MSEEAVARTDEEKAKMYQAMLDGANVITSVLDADNEYGNDLTNTEKQEKVLRRSLVSGHSLLKRSTSKVHPLNRNKEPLITKVENCC